MRTVAYQGNLRRTSAGSEFHPDMARMHYTTNAVLATLGGTLVATLSRGAIPAYATGSPIQTRLVTGTAYSGANTLSFIAQRDSQDILLDGVATDNNVASAIRRCGYDGLYIGAGRAAGGELIVFDGDVQTAIAALGANPAIECDSYVSPGQTIGSVIAGTPYNENVAPLWSSLLGFCDFCETSELTTYHNTLFNRIKNGYNEEGNGQGVNYKLPNQEIIRECAFAAVHPTGTIWISSTDYGSTAANGIPSDVTDNDADRFRNHPGFFLRRKGASVLKSLIKKWDDPLDLTTDEVGQPIGIYQYAGAITLSRWLFLIDGEPNIVFIESPDGTNYRRPKDIWNNVIVPHLLTNESDIRRVNVVDLDGDDIGTDTNWQLTDAALYLGPQGDVTQDNTAPVG